LETPEVVMKTPAVSLAEVLPNLRLVGLLLVFRSTVEPWSTIPPPPVTEPLMTAVPFAPVKVTTLLPRAKVEPAPKVRVPDPSAIPAVLANVVVTLRVKLSPPSEIAVPETTLRVRPWVASVMDTLLPADPVTISPVFIAWPRFVMVAPPVLNVATSNVPVPVPGKAALQLEPGEVSFHVAPSPPPDTPVQVALAAIVFRANPTNSETLRERDTNRSKCDCVFMGFWGGIVDGKGDLSKKGLYWITETLTDLTEGVDAIIVHTVASRYFGHLPLFSAREIMIDVFPSTGRKEASSLRLQLISSLTRQLSNAFIVLSVA
jgi:hypothetical protein